MFLTKRTNQIPKLILACRIYLHSYRHILMRTRRVGIIRNSLMRVITHPTNGLSSKTLPCNHSKLYPETTRKTILKTNQFTPFNLLPRVTNYEDRIHDPLLSKQEPIYRILQNPKKENQKELYAVYS